jgi:GTP-binding protein YchF
MECGIVGLPGAGKTTLFNALTGSSIDPIAGATKPNIGVAHIPDPRLGEIATFIPTKKLVHAAIQFVDIPGVPVGSEPSKLNSFLSHVRKVDAICLVVRSFNDGTPPDPAGDIDKMETELVLTDMVVAESAMDKAKRTARTGDAEGKARVAVLEKVIEALDNGQPIRAIQGWTDVEMGVLKSYGMITAKPVLYIANIGEDDIAGEPATAAKVQSHASAVGSESVMLCAKLEAELAELDDADRNEMLESMGLAEPAIGPMARAVYALLGLASFYTAGEKEVRAWTIRAGSTAPEAAGAVHSDIQRGFIRAECYNIEELKQYKTEKAIREAGKYRSEGKNYRMQDGDVVHFLFNV